MRFWHSSLYMYKIVLHCWSLNFKFISNILHLYTPCFAVFFLFWVAPTACGSFRAQDLTRVTEATRAVAMRTRHFPCCASKDFLMISCFDVIFVCRWFLILNACLPVLVSFPICNALVSSVVRGNSFSICCKAGLVAWILLNLAVCKVFFISLSNMNWEPCWVEYSWW